MGDRNGYAVYLHENAFATLGDAIKPYVCDGPSGKHVACREVDTSGGFVEMTLDGRDSAGRIVDLELMVPSNMIRMIVSTHADDTFGFVPRAAVPLEPALPVVGPTAAPTQAQSGAVPDAATRRDAPVRTPDKP